MANVTESSWLLAALLQSGAAIVAIVGGVMGSRFVSAHLSLAERSFEETLESRTILGLSARRESLVAQLIKEHAKRYTQGAKFLGYLADETQHAIIDLKLSGFDQGEMLLAIQGERVQLEAQLPLALDVVSRRVKRSQPVHSLARMNPKSRGNRHYTAIFRHVYLRAASQFRDESPEHLKAYLALEREVHEADVENQALIAERLQSVSDRLTATERKLKTARGTQKVAKQRVDQIRRADGFLLGLDVLVVVAILTMAPPVVFLWLAHPYYGWWPQAISVSCFVSGITVLGWFLYVYARFIRGDRTSLPARILRWKRPTARWRSGTKGREV